MTGGNIYVDLSGYNITTTPINIPGIFNKIKRSVELGKTLVFTKVTINGSKYTAAQGDIVHPSTISDVDNYMLVARLFGGNLSVRTAQYVDIDSEDNVKLLA